MTEMSFLSSEVLVGDLMSPFDQSGLGAEESLGLLDNYLEVAKHFKPHGFSRDKAKAGSSEWLAVDGLGSPSNNSKEDAFSGTDRMLETMDLKEFVFDALLGIDDLETMPDDLLTTLDDTCDLFAPLTVNPIGHLPESLTKPDQVAPFTFLQPLPFSPGVLSSTPGHSFSLELGSEVDILKEIGSQTPLKTPLQIMIVASGLLSIAPLPGALQIGASHLQVFSVGLPAPNPPGEKMVAAKVKGEKLDKKLKKMEQNKTAATGYRQKKRVEQEALTGECKELEKKNEALKERADSLAKEIQYLKDLIEEVRKTRGKKRVP
uniref:BZIP domain-containing protein n=1 Tax=Pan troglodytes TaxID=9598 RepID=A0A2I3RYB4_PANTR